jgi:hypothetical protein
MGRSVNPSPCSSRALRALPEAAFAGQPAVDAKAQANVIGHAARIAKPEQGLCVRLARERYPHLRQERPETTSAKRRRAPETAELANAVRREAGHPCVDAGIDLAQRASSGSGTPFPQRCRRTPPSGAPV